MSQQNKIIVAGLVLVAVALGAWWYLSKDKADDGTAPVTGTGTACGVAIKDLALVNAGDPVVEMKTAAGCMALELYEDRAPITVANFLTYTNEGFYDNNLITRISKGFVLQAGGGDATTDAPKQGTHDPIHNEAYESGLKNEQYTLSMARLGRNPDGTGNGADTATTEFFINLNTNSNLDATAPGTGYAVFGKVVHGQDVVQAIAQLPVTVSSAHLYCVSLEDKAGGSCPTPPLVLQDMTYAGRSEGVVAVDPCADVAQQSAVAGLITPGAWNVSANSEAMYVYLQNTGQAALAYTWSITGVGGAALPSGWAATFTEPSGTLAAAPCGQDAASAWVATMANLVIPSDAPAGDVAAELRAGGTVTPFTFHVQATRGTVATLGQSVTTHYDLKGEDGARIQEGDFCHKLGATGPGNAVEGYAFGVIGVAQGETVTLIVPPPFAYGFGSGGLAGQWLNWKATLTSTVASCPPR